MKLLSTGALLAWPVPPFHIYADEPAWTQAQACEIEGLKGAIRRCFLVGVADQQKAVLIQIVLSKPPFALAFSQFRKLTLKQPLKPKAGADGEPFSDVIGERYYSSYELTLRTGETLAGRTVGYVETAFGLYLFAPLDAQGTVERQFVPNEAFSTVRFEAVNAPDLEPPLPIDTVPTTLPPGTLKEPQIVSPEQLLQALDKQAKLPLIRLGEALIRLGYISETQLHQALAFRQANDRTPLGQLLVNLGFLSRKKLNTALARKMGYPMVNVAQFPVENDALRKISLTVAQRLMVLPLVLRPNLLVVAASDPTLHGMIEELEFLSQVRVVAVLGDSLQIMSATSSAYQKMGGNAWADSSNLIDFSDDVSEGITGSQLLASMAQQEQRQHDRDVEAPDPQVAASDSKLVRLVNSMIVEAFDSGASAIHVECRPGRANVRIRFRRDSVLAPYLDLPYTYRAAVVERLKVMAELTPSDRGGPCDGKIDFHQFSPRHRLALRLATLPTVDGLEDAVLRLLAPNAPMTLDNLGLSAANLAQWRDAVGQPGGLVLCVGPSGSGRSTTLHATLRDLNKPERKIWTAEDPIAISQPDLRQVQISPSTGWTYARALRAILCADPDVIMVGDLSQTQTARAAVEAALSGRLLLSTLATRHATEAVHRLIGLGLHPLGLAEALQAVLAQRLVRRLCAHCRVQEEAPDALLAEWLDDYLRAFAPAHRPDRAKTLAQWRVTYGKDDRLQHVQARGCEHCHGSGFAGRLALHELLRITPALRALIQTAARPEQIQAEALKSGDFRTLRQDGIVKVLQGLTTLEEVRACDDA